MPVFTLMCAVARAHTSRIDDQSLFDANQRSASRAARNRLTVGVIDGVATGEDTCCRGAR